MNNEPQKYPKWIQAPEGWVPAGKPFREFDIGRDGKMRVIVQDEQDEMEIINFVKSDAE